MQVFRIRLNSNKFQSFLPSDEKVWETDLLKLDCRPKLQSWVPPSVYIDHPDQSKGNFFHFCSAGFVVDQNAKDDLGKILEIAGELLPLPHQDALFHLVNVQQCVNCLDDEASTWVFGKTTSAKIRIAEYRFHANSLPASSLFKIPETARSEVLTVTGLSEPEEDFKTVVERKGLQGLIFEELWSNGQ